MITIKSLLWKVKKDRFQFTEQGLFKMKNPDRVGVRMVRKLILPA
jgi:hypothetical protein